MFTNFSQKLRLRFTYYTINILHRINHSKETKNYIAKTRRWWTVLPTNSLSPILALFSPPRSKSGGGKERRGREAWITRGKLIDLFDERPFLSVSLGPCVCQCHALQFHRQSDAYKNTLKYMNMCFTGMFTVECILKIAAFGVRVSSTNKHQQALPLSPPFIERIHSKENCT